MKLPVIFFLSSVSASYMSMISSDLKCDSRVVSNGREEGAGYRLCPSFYTQNRLKEAGCNVYLIFDVGTFMIFCRFLQVSSRASMVNQV